MKHAAHRRRTSHALWFAVALVALASVLDSGARAQEAPPVPAVGSGASVLPIYGVDLELDPAWVDGAAFPSSSPDHPHQGVSPALHAIWQALAPAAVNTLRVTLDVGDPSATGVRLANLVAWAEVNGASLVPVLVDGTAAQATGESFAVRAAAAVRGAVAALAGQGTTASYSRIVLYQVGREANHAGRNGGLVAEAASASAVAAATALRQAETAALAESGLYLTPILVQASFDYELVRAGTMAGAVLSEEAYAQAYQALRSFLSGVAATPEVDALGVSWYPGSVGAGGPENFSALLSALAAEFPAKQLVFTTGFSTAFRAPEEQRQLVALAFANVADLRASQGDTSPLVGLLFHHALRPAGAATEPPAEVQAALAAWDPAMRAQELAQAWRGGALSPELAWWERRTEEEMGLLSLSGEPGAISVGTQPGADALGAIAAAVGEAVGEAAGGTTAPGEQPGIKQQVGAAVGGLVTQLVGSVLERVFAKIGSEVDEALGGGVAGGAAGTATQVAVETTTGATPSAPAVAIASVALEPVSPQVGQPAAVSVLLHNTGAAAPGLALGLVDADGFLAAEDALAEGVAVAAQADVAVSLPWTPAQAGSQAASVKLYDAAWIELATAPVTLTAEAPAETAPPPPSGGGPRPGVGTLAINPAIVAAVSPKLLRPGYPRVGEMRVEAMKGGVARISLPLSNATSRSLGAMRAVLLLGDEPLATRSLETILPRQTRTVSFDGVRLPAAGAADLRITLAKQGSRPVVMAARRVDVGQVALRPETGAAGAGDRAVKVRSPLAVTAGRVAPAATPTAVARPVAVAAIRPLTVAPRPTPTPAGRPAPIVVARPPVLVTKPAAPAPTPTPAVPPVLKMPPAIVAPRPTPTPAARTATTMVAPMVIILRPDVALLPGGLHVSPASAAAGQRISVRVDVRNVGGAAADGVKASFTLANATGAVVGKGEVTVGAIAANGLKPATWAVTLPAGGPWRVTASVRATADAQSGNNQTAVTVAVAKAGR